MYYYLNYIFQNTKEINFLEEERKNNTFLNNLYIIANHMMANGSNLIYRDPP